MAKRTLAAAEREIANLQLKIKYLEDTRKEFCRAFGELTMGMFVSPDEASEIAREAVSERIC